MFPKLHPHLGVPDFEKSPIVHKPSQESYLFNKIQKNPISIRSSFAGLKVAVP
jgi:hypothetical protein